MFGLLHMAIDRVIYGFDPVKYCRKLGVRIGSNVALLCRYPFGTEPYLVRIGDNVRINYGANFITHEGGGMGFKEFISGIKECGSIWKYNCRK